MYVHAFDVFSVDAQEQPGGTGTHLHTSLPVLRVFMAWGAGFVSLHLALNTCQL